MAQQNVYDQASRYLAKLDPPGFLCWLLELPTDAIVFRGWLDTRRLPFPGEPERVNDTVAHVECVEANHLPWAIPIEFQLEPDATMFGRLLIYEGEIWLELKPTDLPGDRFNLGAVVVNLTGRGNTGRKMEWSKARLRTALELVDTNLCDEQAQTVLDGVAAGSITPVVLAFIPLMQGGSDPGIIQRWIIQASAEPDSRRRGDYGGLALVFAEAARCADVWKQALRGWNVVQSQQVLEWQAQARVEAKIESLVQILESKYGSLPADLDATIQGSTDLTRLNQWLIAAATTNSLADFRAATQL